MQPKGKAAGDNIQDTSLLFNALELHPHHNDHCNQLFNKHSVKHMLCNAQHLRFDIVLHAKILLKMNYCWIVLN